MCVCGARARARGDVSVFTCACARSYVAASEGLAAASRRGRTEEVSFVVVSFPRSKTAIQKELALSLSLPPPPPPPSSSSAGQEGKRRRERGPRVLRGLSAHRDGRRVSRRGFSLGRGLRKSLSPVPSPSPLRPPRLSTPSVIPSPASPPSRSTPALPIGADTPRGVEADLARFGAARPPSAPLVYPFVRPSVRPSARRASSPSQSVSLIETACVHALVCAPRSSPPFRFPSSRTNTRIRGSVSRRFFSSSSSRVPHIFSSSRNR